MGKTLVDPSAKLIPIRIFNSGRDNLTLHPDTVVGTFQPVMEVKAEQLNPSTTQESSSQELPQHLQELYERCGVSLDEEQRSKVKAFLIEFQDVFSRNDADLGRTGLVKHRIDTGNNKPVKQPLRRFPIHRREEEEKLVKEMLDKGVIERSNSPWSSAIVMIKKKDGSTRCCIDYRRVNELTVKDAYPLPMTEDCFDALYGSQWFSTLDLSSGYWQVELDPVDRPKSAFITRSGLFQFKVMPMGLCNSGATFERLMELVMAGIQWKI